MALTFRIISVGTLSRHPLWPHDRGGRTPHATTTLIVAGDRRILVDPSLPPRVIEARLAERTGLTPGQITDVFLTCFRPAHRYGLTAFDGADWFIGEREREVVGVNLVGRLEQADDSETEKLLTQEIALLKRCRPAPDALAEGVDLFPSHGYTPGLCGLLLALPGSTVLVAGDAVPTVEHAAKGQVLAGAFDVEQSQASFAEAVEIADLLVPGHDNVVMNPARRPF